MTTFTNNQGQSWEVQINVATLKRVRDILGIDLVNDPETKNLSQLADDEIMIVDVIYLICRDQAVERNISDEEFGKCMAGDAITQACNALMEGLANFFQSPSKRRAIKIMTQAATKIETAMQNQLNDPAIEKKIDTAINELMSGKSSMNLQASSASTQPP